MYSTNNCFHFNHEAVIQIDNMSDLHIGNNMQWGDFAQN